MKFAATALFAGLAVAETVTISHFVFVAVNGYPQLSFRAETAGGDVSCGADHYVVDGPSYPCEDPAWTFTIGEAQGHRLTLSHTVDGRTMSGDFVIGMNGPLSTVLDQVGTSTADLDKDTTNSTTY